MNLIPRSSLISLATTLTFLSSPSFSEPPVSVNGEYIVSIKQHRNSTTRKINSNKNQTRYIKLPKLKLSQDAKKALLTNISHALSNANADETDTQEPEKIFLGMNGVPVLDQNPWRSCVTFATTAAIDAYYGLTDGNQISQLCNLELGLTLGSSNPYGGWAGASIGDVLSQISIYGYLTQNYQQKNGCAGLKDYPSEGDSIGLGMDPLDFSNKAKHKFRKADWQKVIDVPNSLTEYSDRYKNKDVVLNQLKGAIRRGHRLVISLMLLPAFNGSSVGEVGALGSYKAPNDTWLLTQNLLDLAKTPEMISAGHALILTGFDDGCISVTLDNSQTKQCGYVVVRNSWGESFGDHGDNYVSYDYLATFLMDAYEIGR